MNCTIKKLIFSLASSDAYLRFLLIVAAASLPQIALADTAAFDDPSPQ